MHSINHEISFSLLLDNKQYERYLIVNNMYEYTSAKNIIVFLSNTICLYINIINKT